MFIRDRIRVKGVTRYIVQKAKIPPEKTLDDREGEEKTLADEGMADTIYEVVFHAYSKDPYRYAVLITPKGNAITKEWWKDPTEMKV